MPRSAGTINGSLNIHMDWSGTVHTAIRRACQSVPVLRNVYCGARRIYHRKRLEGTARGYFINYDDFDGALRLEDGRLIEINTKDGLSVTIRRNYMDAVILAEVFLDNCYVRYIDLPPEPVVVDIGGYIGDFALYAAKRLNARRVVVCEPSPRNWVLLERNVASNHYKDRILTVNKAVTDGGDVFMDVDAPDRVQAMVSAFGADQSGRKRIPGITLKSVLDEHGIDTVDLLKIDCEGGEYSILSSTPANVFRRIRRIVFEYHEIDGFAPRLKSVKEYLRDNGYRIVTHRSLVWATR